MELNALILNCTLKTGRTRRLTSAGSPNRYIPG
jgi:hypothetical protein